MKNDRKATYERLYHEHAPYCLRRTSTEEAKDAMADVFVVAWRRFDDIPDPDNALPWLYGVARNVLAHRAGTARRRKRLAIKAAATHEATVPGPEAAATFETEDLLFNDLEAAASFLEWAPKWVEALRP